MKKEITWVLWTFNICMQEALIQFIAEELLTENQRPALSPDANLLIGGLVDSLGMVRLMGFIEEEFDVEVLPEDATIENFRTINAIADYLQRRAAQVVTK